MEVVYPQCCGLDVHKKIVTACIITPKGKEIRTFFTMTNDILELSDWMHTHKVSHVAMESTGVYWKPIYNLLEDEFTLLLVNAQHIKAVPGRKTDVKDAEWIAELLRHGLVRGSFVPDRSQRELRDMIRYRRSLIDQRSQVINRIQKVLEGANIKLSSVATDITGVSGRSILEAMISGVEDPKVLADMAKARLRNKRASLEEALNGLFGTTQRALVASQLRHLDFLDSEIAQLSNNISGRTEHIEESIQRLDTIPGVGRQTAEEILIEIGTDMSRFATAQHLASWARVCPGNNESAGKHRSGRTGHGNHWLRSSLIQASWAAVRAKHNYLASIYHRIAHRRGKKRAIMAVGHCILTGIYFMIRKNTDWKDLGESYFDERHHERVVNKAVRRLENLGYSVALTIA